MIQLRPWFRAGINQLPSADCNDAVSSGGLILKGSIYGVKPGKAFKIGYAILMLRYQA